MGAVVVVGEDANADPPVSGRTGETQDFRGVIAALEVIGELGCGGFMREAADLDRPFSGSTSGRGRLHQLNLYFGNAGFIHIQLLRGGEGEIEDASGYKGTAIGDADERGSSGLNVGDADDGTQRIRAVSGCHGVHVVDFAVRSATVVVRRAVPAGEPGFRGNRLGVRGKRGLGKVGVGVCVFGCLASSMLFNGWNVRGWAGFSWLRR